MRHLIIVAAHIVLLASTIGCVPKLPPKVTYVAAKRTVEPPPPAVDPVAIPKPMPMPGQLKRRPDTESVARKKQPPKTVIDSANSAAKQHPDSDTYFNAIMQYDYAPGALYQVYAAPMKVTAIALQEGETLTADPVSGDSVQWVFSANEALSGAQTQQFIYLKPTRPGLETTLVLNTNRRTYFLELHSFEETYMASVRWRYPHDELKSLVAKTRSARREKAKVIDDRLSISDLNFGYVVKTVQGKPSWKPNDVFDDGRRTYIRFPKRIATRESPVLFVISNDDENQLVNYRVASNYYVVDRIFERAELRLGSKVQDVVRIVRQAGAR